MTVHYDLLQTANFQLASNVVCHKFVTWLKRHSGHIYVGWTPAVIQEIGGGASTLRRITTSEVALIISTNETRGVQKRSNCRCINARL